MKLPSLSPRLSLHAKRILVRVDWNIPLQGPIGEDVLLKVRRSAETIRALRERGAVVIVLTHLGRPSAPSSAWSTRRLVPLIEEFVHLPVGWIAERIDQKKELVEIQRRVKEAPPGTVVLLENVRFFSGEERNDPKLAKAYASLGELFINEAFASSHRAHASISALTNYLPSVAGPALYEEVSVLERLVHKPKSPFYAFLGGLKVSTKINSLTALSKKTDRLYIGGAMANTLFAAQGRAIGKSLYEPDALPLARKLLKQKNILLPLDVLVVRKAASPGSPRVSTLEGITAREMIVDIGPLTVRTWAEELRKAKTLMWNGPMGKAEYPAYAHGSVMLGRAIAARSKGKAFGVVGGGDTLPLAVATGMQEWFDYLSTGGGAMLEFIARDGALPALTALQTKRR